jgi:hypothetical protein
MTRGVKGSGKPRGGNGDAPAHARRRITPLTDLLETAPAEHIDKSPRCRICSAVLEHGNCRSCQWRAARYAPVLKAIAHVCECGAPAKRKRCPPCQTLFTRAKARGITLPEARR